MKKERKEAQKIVKNEIKKEQSSRKTKREIFDKTVFQTIKVLRNDGFSHRAIAEKLNDSGIATRQGGQWHTTSVQRITQRNAL